MAYTIEKKDNKAIITLTIPADEVQSGMESAAEQLSSESSIPGFRPGKAPYEVVKKRFGEMKLLEAAAEDLIRSAFVSAMVKENLETVGQPYFDVEKMVPGNDMVVKAEIALYPHLKEMADYNDMKVEKKDIEPTKDMVDRAKKDLALMQTKEVRKEQGAEIEKGDKAVVDLTMKKDGVVVEGGEGKSHGIYTGEPHYIEGMVDNILGAKEGEERTFTLPFPKEHYQKHLAGQDIDFTVTVKEIFKLDAPEINDEFAKSLGMQSSDQLEEKLKENLRMENEKEESLRQEKEILDKLVEASEFEEIPDILVNQEINQMIQELEHNIAQRGMKFDEYLKGINKTVADLKLDFSPTALKRVKAAILIKEIIKQEGIEVDEKAVDEEIDRIAKQYEGNDEAKKRVYDPRFRQHVEQQMKNRKAVELLKEKMVA